MTLGAVDGAKRNLADTFVNAFLNTGYCSDKMVIENGWIYKQKDTAMLTATASIGLIMLWNVEQGLAHIDKYLYSEDENIKAGALLAIGMLNAGVRNEEEPALALLSEYCDSKVEKIKMSAVMGLGIAYSGTLQPDVRELLLTIVSDSTISMALVGMAAVALGQVCVGSGDGDVASTILQTLMEREGDQRWLALGLGLVYLGRQAGAAAVVETLKAVGGHAQALVEGCAYAGTGNVLKVQEMLAFCNQDNALAVLGVGIVAMGEEVGAEMALRTFSHLVISYSNFRCIMDPRQLSKLFHWL